MYANSNIESIKLDSVIEKLRILYFPALAFFYSIKRREPKELYIIINYAISIITKPINSFQCIIAALKTTIETCESK